MAVEIQQIDLEHPHRRLLQHAARILAARRPDRLPDRHHLRPGRRPVQQGGHGAHLQAEEDLAAEAAQLHLSGPGPGCRLGLRAHQFLPHPAPGHAGEIHLRPARQQGGAQDPAAEAAHGGGAHPRFGRWRWAWPASSAGRCSPPRCRRARTTSYTDPQAIADTFRHDVDLVLDAGVLANQPSTIIDLSGPAPAVHARRRRPHRALRPVNARPRPKRRIAFRRAPVYNRAG